MTDIVIVAAKRIPQGRYLGSLAQCSAVDLALASARAAMRGIPPELIDQVILGNVLSAGLGMNVARQLSLRLGLPQRVPAYTVNMMCGSGMQAVILAAQAIRAGDANVVLCGGCESMSNAPFLKQRDEKARVLEHGDHLLRDGLTDPLSNEHMGVTAERLATTYAISREEQDAFAVLSHQRYAAAHAAGHYADEWAPIDGLDRDEHHRPGLAAAKLATLPTVFAEHGSVTPGNASGINDGAAMMLVTSQTIAQRHGWPVCAHMRAWCVVGCDPAAMGLGPAHAIRALRERHGIRAEDCDHLELNEAFAAQAIACQRELGLDPLRINPNGGAIAIGHPIGATGARLLVHLAQRTARGATQRSLASLCIGGGMGAAVALESPARTHS